MRHLLHTQRRPAVTIVLLLTAINFIACRHRDTNSQLETAVDSFATHYYNWQFKQAIPYCTPESEVWLRFAASNVQQEDVDLLREQSQGADHRIDDIRLNAGDSTAIVSFTVHHYLRMDTIGHAGQFVDAATFHIPVIRRNNQWLVHLTELPRSKSLNK